MKKIILCGMLATTVLFTSCIGSFTAFTKLRDWNESVTDNQFGNELIFVGLAVFQVYSAVLIGDLFIFNAIEFWGGDNPVAMQEGESETRTISRKGNTYAITATKNRFHIEIIDGERKGETSDLVYVPGEKSWNVENEDGELVKLSSLKKGLLMAHLPNGETVEVPKNLSRPAMQDYLAIKIDEYNTCQYAELIME